MDLFFKNALRKTPAVQEILAEFEQKFHEEHKRELAEKDRILAEKDRILAEIDRIKAEQSESTRERILRVLGKRFGTVSSDIAVQLKAVQAQQKLDDLLIITLDCADLDAFRVAIATT